MVILRQLAVFAAATVVVAFLLVWSADSFGFRSPVFAFLVNWLVMSWVAVTGQVVHITLAPGYYEIKPFEQNGRVYERLGVRLFKRLVRRGPLTMFSPTLRLPGERTVPALRALEAEMRKAETGHVLILAVMLLFICYALVQWWLDAVAWLLLFNALFNGYPTMLQRYNRLKLQFLIRQSGVGSAQEEETNKGHGGTA